MREVVIGKFGPGATWKLRMQRPAEVGGIIELREDYATEQEARDAADKIVQERRIKYCEDWEVRVV
jgi:hypothetical protein